MNYRIISADDHIDLQWLPLQWLPKDLWQKRVPAQNARELYGLG
jgi:hypothetical protein